LEVFQSYRSFFDEVNLAIAIKSLGKSYFRLSKRGKHRLIHHQGFHDIVDDIARMMVAPRKNTDGSERLFVDAWKSREVSTITHTIAKVMKKLDLREESHGRLTGLACKIRDIFTVVSENSDWFVESVMGSGIPQDISHVAYAFAKLKFSSPKLFQRINDSAAFILKNGTPTEIADTMRAFAELGTPAPKLFSEIAKHPSYLVANGSPKDVANIARAFAEFDVQAPLLFGEIAGDASRLARTSISEELDGIVWAFSKLNITVPKSLSHRHLPTFNRCVIINKQITEEAGRGDGLLAIFEREGENFNSVNWATIVTRLGKLQRAEIEKLKQSGTFRSFLSDLTAKMASGKPDQLRASWSAREVSNVVYSLAKMNLDIREIMDAVVANSSWLAEKANPQEIAITAWAFATLNSPAAALFKSIDECSARLVKDGNSQEISNTVWSFGKLGFPAPTLCKEIDENPLAIVKHGNPHDIANAAWAFAKLNASSPILFEQIDKKASYLVEN
jgi:hypothetical protein